MGFEDLAIQNKQIGLDNEEKSELLKEIKEKLYLWREQCGKYESLPQYFGNLNQKFDTTINEFINFFREKGFSLSQNQDEIVAELNQLGLKITLSLIRVDQKLQLYCIEKDNGKFHYNIILKEGNEFHRNSKIYLIEDELSFSNSRNKENISYLKAELETIELDLSKLRNRTNTGFPIDFLLYWEDKETEHVSLIEILEQIEKEYFD